MKLRWMMLVVAFLGCSQMNDEAKRIEIDTPDGEVTAYETTEEPVAQDIVPATDEQVDLLKSLAERGPEFVAHYLPSVADASLQDYDRAFRAWQTSDNKAHTSEQVTQALGAILGMECVTGLDMEWVIVTDEYGTDYAVRSKSVEAMAFPFSTVLKRIEDNQYAFMHAVYHAVAHTIKSTDVKTRDAETESK